jgi:hypothetical protein
MNTILWNINFPTLMAMLADAPRYVQGERNETVEIKSEEDLKGLISSKYDKK